MDARYLIDYSAQSIGRSEAAVPIGVAYCIAGRSSLFHCTTPGGFNYKTTIPSEHDGWIYRLRADYDLNASNTFYLSYQQGYDTSAAGPHAFRTPSNSIPTPGGEATAFSKTKALAGHFVHIFRQTLTNEFIASWGYGDFNDFNPVAPSAFYRSTLSYPGTYGTIFSAGAKVIPSYSSAGNWTFPDFSQWDVADNGGLAFRKEMPAFRDNLTLVWKTYTITTGLFTENVSDLTPVANNGSQDNGAINGFGGQYPNIVLLKPIATTCDWLFSELPYLIDSKVVGEAGIEPTTPGLEGRCSIQLSYSPAVLF